MSDKEIDKMFQDFEDDIFSKKKKTLHVAFIIDSSGSMGVLRKFVVDIFNDQLEVLKSETDDQLDTKVSIVTFSYPDKINFLRWDDSISDINPLDMKEYIPDGNTALFDAIGKTLTKLQELPDVEEKTTSFLVNIITDGQENASRIYNLSQIRGRISDLQKTERWTITYYGTEPEKIQEEMDMFLSNTYKFDNRAMANGLYNVTLTNATKSYMADIKSGKGYSANFYGKPIDGFYGEEEKEEKKKFFQTHFQTTKDEEVK
jgi:hypothetical protein